MENKWRWGDLYLQGEGKVLGHRRPRRCARTGKPLVAALKQGERIGQVRWPTSSRADPLSLLPYISSSSKCARRRLRRGATPALHDAVYNQGTGSSCSAARRRSGRVIPPRWSGRVPVDNGRDCRKKCCRKARVLALVLHTCEFAEGNTWAKTHREEAIRVLGGEDEVGLLDLKSRTATSGFSRSRPRNTSRRSSFRSSTRRRRRHAGVSQHHVHGIHGAERERRRDEALHHHFRRRSGPPQPRCWNQFHRAQKSLSRTVAINPHGGHTVISWKPSEQNRRPLFTTRRSSQLPSIFVKEAKTLKRSMLQNKTFSALVEFPSPILKGIDAMPQLHGFVLTTPKPRASVVLKAPPDAQETAAGDSPDPVLATWRYGLGTTAAWTSDLAPNWARDWVGWEKYRAFVKQLATEVSRVEQRTDLTMAAFASGGQGIVTVEDFAKGESFLELKARVSGPRGETLEVPLKQIAPRRYQGEFPLCEKAATRSPPSAWHQRTVTGRRNATGIRRIRGAVFAEYLRFKSNPIALKQIAERTGGRVLSRPIWIFSSTPLAARKLPALFDWFLIALACLIPLDVGLRRVQLDWLVIKGWFGFGRKAGSTETMGALLQRKKEVQSAIAPAERPKPVVLPATPTATAASPAASLPKPQTKPDEPPTTEQPQSTTERLLARKRKRDQDNPS